MALRCVAPAASTRCTLPCCAAAVLLCFVRLLLRHWAAAHGAQPPRRIAQVVEPSRTLPAVAAGYMVIALTNLMKCWCPGGLEVNRRCARPPVGRTSVTEVLHQIGLIQKVMMIFCCE